MRTLERLLLHESEELPPAYHDELRQFIRRSLHASLTSHGDGAIMQRHFRMYGELCSAWPTIVGASRSMNVEGGGLGVRALA